MKRKEVEDVMGGKDAWANVDKTDGMYISLILGIVSWLRGLVSEGNFG